MSLIINTKGRVVHAGNSPRSLFGFDAADLIGIPLANILDIFQPPLELAASMDQTAIEDHEDEVAKMLLFMATK